MVVGAMKCGTTTLCHYLGKHPDIGFSNPKEPCFFSQSPDWQTYLDNYHAIFPPNKKIYGEGSTEYTKSPLLKSEIWKDIHTYNPDMKIIYMVRNPFERIISHYVFQYIRFKTDSLITKAIHEIPGIIEISKYYYQILPYLKQFGPENVLILDLDDYVKNPSSMLRECFSFVGANEEEFNYQQKFVNKNPTEYGINAKNAAKLLAKKRRMRVAKPRLNKKDREWITAQLKQDVADLSIVAQKDFSHWLD